MSDLWTNMLEAPVTHLYAGWFWLFPLVFLVVSQFQNLADCQSLVRGSRVRHAWREAGEADDGALCVSGNHRKSGDDYR
jgi:hypothetical protein